MALTRALAKYVPHFPAKKNPLLEVTQAKRAELALSKWRESAISSAVGRFGFRVRHATQIASNDLRMDVAVLHPNGGDIGVPMVVGIMSTPPDLVEVVDSKTPNFSLFSMAVPGDASRYLAMIENALSESGGEEGYEKLLSLAKAHFMARLPSGRLAVVSADLYHTINVDEGAPNSTSGANLVSVQGFGRLLWSVLTDAPLKPEAETYMHPLLYADGVLGFAEDGGAYYNVGGNDSIRHTLWAIVPDQDPVSLSRLQDLPVHLYWFIHNSYKEGFWGWLVARASGTAEELDDLETSMQACGQVYRIPKWNLPFQGNLEQACFSAVPGNPNPPLGAKHFSIPNWEVTLPQIVSKVGGENLHLADLPIGKTMGRLPQSMFVDSDEVISMGFVGQSKSGKSVLAFHTAMQKTRNVVAVLMTSGSDDKALGRFAESIGGQFRNLPLPSVTKVDEWEPARVEVEDEINTWLDSMAAEWAESGVITGLPLVLRLESGSSVLYTYYVTYFLTRMREIMRDTAEQTGKRFIVIIDDLVGIPGSVPDEHLGNISVDKGAALRQLLDDMKNYIRKYGADNIFFTMHSKEELNSWPDGFWKSLGLCLELVGNSSHSLAGIWAPQFTDRSASMPTYDPKVPWDANALPGFQGFFNPRLPAKTLALMLGQ